MYILYIQAMEQMQKEYIEEKGNKGNEGLPDLERLNIESMTLDNSSFASVMQFVQEFKSSGRKLHVIVCNAGMTSTTFGIYQYIIYFLNYFQRSDYT